MKKFAITIIIAWLLLMGQPGMIFADYVMMCTFFQNPESRVYSVSDDGDISMDYFLEVGGYPLSIEFAPNGKWGLVGQDTTEGHPERQIIVILNVDKNRNISVYGTFHNEHHELVAISPDSKVGIFGNYLQSIIYHPDGTFTLNNENNEFMANRYAAFSSWNGRILAEKTAFIITEYKLNLENKVIPTYNTKNISPSSGNEDLEISPDGKTCIVLSIGTHEIVVLRIRENGGFSLLQAFNTDSMNPCEVVFTPDSQYAIIVFDTRDNVWSYKIEDNSSLTFVDALDLPGSPGEDIDITPDGKFLVTRALYVGYSHFMVVRIHENGTLEYLPEKDYYCGGHVSAMAFVPPQITSTDESWTFYE